MPYVTSIERLAREEGHKEGVAEGMQIAVIKLLEHKFNELPSKHSRKVRSVHEIERLSALLQAATDARTLDEVLSLL